MGCEIAPGIFPAGDSQQSKTWDIASQPRECIGALRAWKRRTLASLERGNHEEPHLGPATFGCHAIRDRAAAATLHEHLHRRLPAQKLAQPAESQGHRTILRLPRASPARGRDLCCL